MQRLKEIQYVQRLAWIAQRLERMQTAPRKWEMRENGRNIVAAFLDCMSRGPSLQGNQLLIRKLICCVVIDVQVFRFCSESFQLGDGIWGM